MKLFVGIVLLCVAATSYAAPRIFGGKDAPEGKYPYQVSLRNAKHELQCGGSILNKRWILTAAHCISRESPKTIKVVAGTTLIHGGEEQVYHVEYLITHNNYNEERVINDIGLIRVNKDIQINDKVQPVALPPKGEESYKAGDSAKLTGWGLNGFGLLPNHLQELNVEICDQEKCKKEIANSSNVTMITYSHICTLSPKGQGGCFGDSGSPLVIDGVQIGLVSYGIDCADGTPDVDTRVHTFLDWISDEHAKFDN